MGDVHRLYFSKEVKHGWILSLVGILESPSVNSLSLCYKSTAELLIVSGKLHFFSLWRKEANICMGKTVKSRWRKSPVVSHPSGLRAVVHREASGAAVATTEGHC